MQFSCIIILLLDGNVYEILQYPFLKERQRFQSLRDFLYSTGLITEMISTNILQKKGENIMISNYDILFFNLN